MKVFDRGTSCLKNQTVFECIYLFLIESHKSSVGHQTEDHQAMFY